MIQDNKIHMNIIFIQKNCMTQRMHLSFICSYQLELSKSPVLFQQTHFFFSLFIIAEFLFSFFLLFTDMNEIVTRELLHV